MKKTFKTNNGKEIELFEKKGYIYTCENYDDKIVGTMDEDEDGFFANDYLCERNISVIAADEEAVFEAFCAAYIAHLNEREANRAAFIEKMRGLLEDLEGVNITEDYSEAIQDVYKVVNTYTSGGNGEW